ncbi:MAG: hypothetical protein K0R77_1902 [Chryseobacterium sp.]|jgi:hypothetical protein|uniref:hypothetical protein n=1 Tax=Chryseobacterium sp. TaxID=1871047 RepID=UPI0026290A71|nr:hypothetical protein [Chryseobacterium sp.]MDF2552627.1 hypothetical protein [Chryseobacterium sp.]
MIFEDKPHTILQEKSSMPQENFKFITNIIAFNGDKSFILSSLQRIKNSTLCKIKRKTIDKFIKEYATIHFDGYVENDSYILHSEEYQMTPAYAKQSYEKVLKEQEYLNRLITTLNID